MVGGVEEGKKTGQVGSDVGVERKDRHDYGRPVVLESRWSSAGQGRCARLHHLIERASLRRRW
jgi:hypothetical protein